VGEAGIVTGRTQERGPVIVEDIDEEPAFRLGLEWAIQAGFRAVQMTPLIVSDGKVVGMLCEKVVCCAFPVRVRSRPAEEAAITAGVPQIADDLLRRTGRQPFNLRLCNEPAG
jgi:hypothetical protein